jgi:hypothetical protein
MRHARLAAALPIGLLALAVIVPAYRGVLVSAARCPQLLLPHSPPATVTAIALTTITTRTDSEKRVARRVKASPHAKALSRLICCHGGGHSHHDTTAMIGQTTGAFGAMMSLAPGRGSENYVFR